MQIFKDNMEENSTIVWIATRGGFLDRGATMGRIKDQRQSFDFDCLKNGLEGAHLSYMVLKE